MIIPTHWHVCAGCKVEWPHNARGCEMGRVTDTCPPCEYRKAKRGLTAISRP